MGVLKKNNVKQAEPCSLGAAPRTGSAGSLTPQPQASIVEQDENHALVEVVCACGAKSYLNCLFPSSAAAGTGAGSA